MKNLPLLAAAILIGPLHAVEVTQSTDQVSIADNAHNNILVTGKIGERRHS